MGAGRPTLHWYERVVAAVRPYLPEDPAGWRAWGLRGLLFAVLTAFTWPVGGVTVGTGADPSWQLGLPFALEEGLVWGRDIIFTYGPLGFTVYPTAASSATLLPALLIAGAVHFLLVAALYVAFRRQYGPVGSALLTFLVAAAVGSVQSDATLVTGYVLAVLVLTLPFERAPRAVTAFALGASALAAFTLLVKLNDGAAVTAIVAIALLASPSPRRSLAIGIGTGALTLVAIWMLLGQPVPAIFDYFRNANETIRGYVESMGIEEAGAAGEWHLLVIVGSAVVTSALAWTSFPRLGNRRLGAVVLAILLVHYFVLREVFVRHTLTKGAYIVLLIPVVLAIPWPRPRRSLALTIGAALTIAFLASFPRSPDRIWDPLERTDAMAQQLHDAAVPQRVDRIVAEGRASIDAAEPVPATVVEALRGGCVTAEPAEIAVVWSHELDWCPLPALQSYNAYTSRLDEMDADRYADPEDGPDRVIRNYYAIDGRLPAWESPAAMLSLLCNFGEAARGGDWQALARVPDRCGEPRPAGSVEGTLGEPIELPEAPPGTVLLAHVDGLQITTFERLKMLFGRPEARTIAIDASRPYRVVPGTVGDGLIVSVPPEADYRSPFNLGTQATTLTPAIGTEGGPVRIELTAVPIEAGPEAGPDSPS